MAEISIREATVDDIKTIQEITYTTWPVTYGSIVSAEQLKYMLDLIYSDTSLQNQMKQNHNFLLVEEDKKAIAFADYGVLKDDVYKLHKIYVLPNQQGKSIGRLLINHVAELVKNLGATSLLLNVNRYNKAKQFYEHVGFKVIGEEDVDIGEGYFMNDYVMSLPLTANR